MKGFDGEKLAKDLKQKRFVELGWDMRATGEAIGVSAATLCRLENNEGKPNIEHFFKVCKWLKKPMEGYFS